MFLSTLSAVISAIVAICKAMPEAEKIMEGVFGAYIAWKKEQNEKLTTDRANRDDAAIAAAVSGMPNPLCSVCPFASDPGRRNLADNSAPPVSPNGASGTGIN